MKSLLISTALGMCIATTALAGNPAPLPQVAVAVVPPAPVAHDWSGLYAGGLVSFDSGDAERYTTDILISSFPLEDTTGFGAFIGYNKQVNALVFGGELAYTNGDVQVERLPTTFYKDRIDLKARIGYSFGRVMAYGVVGYSFAEMSDFNEPYPSSGINYGAGVDVMISDRLFVGAEYLMRDLSGESGVNRVEGNLDSAVIRVGMQF